MSMLGKNWKTTVAGVVAGGLVAIVPMLQSGEFSWGALAAGFAVGCLGYFSKSVGVSGTQR